MTTAVYASCVALLMIGSYRPLRSWNTTSRSSNRDITGSMRFIQNHASRSDYVVILNPESAMVELGRCDFLWRPKRGSIFKYVGQDGEVRERNSGATVIDDLPKLKSLMAQGRRIWIVAQNANLDSSGPDTAGQIANYVKLNFHYVAQPLGISLMMWDPAEGHLRRNANTFGEDSNGLVDDGTPDVSDAVPGI